LVGDFVTYTPATNFVGFDAFTFTIDDAWGDAVVVSAVIDVVSGDGPTLNMFPLVYTPAAVRVSFAGIVGRSYSVQRAENPAGPWVTLGTVMVGGDGIGTLLDENPPSTGAFYRTSYP
jgi:hypothetical protein